MLSCVKLLDSFLNKCKDDKKKLEKQNIFSFEIDGCSHVEKYRTGPMVKFNKIFSVAASINLKEKYIFVGLINLILRQHKIF